MSGWITQLQGWIIIVELGIMLALAWASFGR